MTGVFVDKNDCVVLNVFDGKVPVVKPNRYAKAWLVKFICGVIAIIGYDQLLVGLVYPNDSAVASVGIAYTFICVEYLTLFTTNSIKYTIFAPEFDVTYKLFKIQNCWILKLISETE